jgi:hypothetical protein
VRRDCLSVVKRWADRFDERPASLREQIESVALHARPAVSSDLAYILKQRQFNGPCERPSQPWQRSESFAGTRVSFTKMARGPLAFSNYPVRRDVAPIINRAMARIDKAEEVVDAHTASCSI